MMMDDEFRRHAAELRKMIADSAYFIALAPRPEDADAKMALEIGFAILLDKPVIAILRPDAMPSERLLRIAEKVIHGDITTDEGKEKIAAELTGFMPTPQ